MASWVKGAGRHGGRGGGRVNKAKQKKKKKKNKNKNKQKQKKKTLKKKKRWKILYQFMKKNTLDYFQSINCINVYIHGNLVIVVEQVSSCLNVYIYCAIHKKW